MTSSEPSKHSAHRSTEDRRGAADVPLPAPAIVPHLGKIRVHALRGYRPRVFGLHGEFLTEFGFLPVDRPKDADILIGREMKAFKTKVLDLGRLNILWTKEPYHDFSTANRVLADGRPVHVFNVFNNNVYTDNYLDLPKRGAKPVRLRRPKAPLADKRIVGVMTNKPIPMIVNGEDRSLLHMRERFGLAGHAAGGLDLYGAGWPEGVSEGADRTNPHHKTLKRRILRRYNYCFCPENCCWDYYVTEKLWEAVFGRCLPIYYANDTIMELPFIDAAILINDHPTYDAVAAAIENIREREFVDRLNTLIAAGNRAISLGLGGKSLRRTRRLLANFMKSMA